MTFFFHLTFTNNWSLGQVKDSWIALPMSNQACTSACACARARPPHTHTHTHPLWALIFLIFCYRKEIWESNYVPLTM